MPLTEIKLRAQKQNGKRALSIFRRAKTLKIYGSLLNMSVL